MRRAFISIISILLFFQGNVLAVDQTRCRVERRYLAFFTPWGKEPPTPPDIVEEVLGDMVESILTEALSAETEIVDMDHLVGASMKHTYHVHLWYAYRFVHNHKFKTPWKTGMKTHLTDGMKDFFDPNIEGKKVLKVPCLQQKEIFLRNLKRNLKKNVKNIIDKIL